MATLLSRFGSIALKRPRMTGGVVAFALSSVGDLTAQRVEQSQDSSGKGTPSDNFEYTYDLRRAAGMGVFSACFAAFLSVPFHRIVNKKFGEGTIKAAVQKTAADIFGMTPLVGVPSFFVWTSFMQGHSLHEFTDRWRANYTTTALGYAGVLLSSCTSPCLC